MILELDNRRKVVDTMREGLNNRGKEVNTMNGELDKKEKEWIQ